MLQNANASSSAILSVDSGRAFMIQVTYKKGTQSYQNLIYMVQRLKYRLLWAFARTETL